MNILNLLVLNDIKIHIKLFLGQSIFKAKIIVENEAF